MTHALGEEPEFVDVSALPLVADEHWLAAQGNGTELPRPFAGLSHAEVLALEFPPERMLVQDLIPIGAVGTIAGVPETYKSWQAQHLAVMVASGQGELFGKAAEHRGPVGYFWQDDSTREEAERIKLYDATRRDGSELQVRWFLNEGLRLPGDMLRLKMTIREFGFVLVVLDSFYNILFGMDLKDDEAEQVVALLKTEIADALGCTVLIVDHMPWATEQNRKRLRAYGGVFKGAAIRFGIYLDAVGNKTYVEARGNNITGFKRQLAEWDADELELKLLDLRQPVDEDEYEKRIIEFVTHNPNARTEDVNAAGGNRAASIRARKRLEGRKILFRTRMSGTSYKGVVWNLNADAGLASTGTGIERQELLQLVPGTNQFPPVGGGTAGTGWDTPVYDADDELPF